MNMIMSRVSARVRQPIYQFTADPLPVPGAAPRMVATHDAQREWQSLHFTPEPSMR